MAQDRMTWEEHVSEFLNADEQQQAGLWRQAEIALAVMEQYGRSDREARTKALRKFASEVMRSASTLQKYARTAAFFPGGPCAPHLSFTHHRIAANHCPDPQSAETAICKAADELWSTRQLQRFLVEAYSLTLEGTLTVFGPGRFKIDDTYVGSGLVARFDGLRVRLQVKVMTESE